MTVDDQGWTSCEHVRQVRTVATDRATIAERRSSTRHVAYRVSDPVPDL